MRKILIAIFLSLALACPAFAELNVAATLPWIGSLAMEIGKDKITVATLVKPNQDPHIIEARPGMILAGRKAGIIMYNGLDLEIGYLPLILESARNPKIMPGAPGNFDCSRFVKVLEKNTAVDRSMGDVHPLGNPHYHFSPANVLLVAEGMSNALAALDRPNEGFYMENLRNFTERLKERQKKWSAISLKGKKFVAYHKLFEYLASGFGFQITNYVEQKPGIPPSAAHIEGLIEDMKANKPDGILTTAFYGKKEAESISSKTGIKVIVLPADVGSEKGTGDWFAFMDQVLAIVNASVDYHPQ
ncbi:MAG: zinc ABC transporter substrate-binding protein [Nitrospinae bacterium]|nr:zinc ABC transporter substrate-binding protein [Nitrospinota bacterium]